jgi:hypothetical protein
MADGVERVTGRPAMSVRDSVSLFPISSRTQRNQLDVALFPAIAIALHVLLGPLLEEVVYRGLFCTLRPLAARDRHRSEFEGVRGIAPDLAAAPICKEH